MSVTLSKGQNAPLSARSIVVTVDLPTGSDLSALMVAADGKVRSDADFIFFNQPDGPGVRCRQPQPGHPWRIEMDLSQVPPQIDQVRVVVALEDTAGRFGSFAPPVAKVFDAAGILLVQYESVGLSSENIVIVLEVYRRGADWKVRAVGQGYAGGLADLISDHGVSVDDGVLRLRQRLRRRRPIRPCPRPIRRRPARRPTTRRRATSRLRPHLPQRAVRFRSSRVVR